MARKAIHWAEGRAPEDILAQTLCGRLEPLTATRTDEVTCKLCLKRLSEGFVDDSVERYVGSRFEPRPMFEYDHALIFAEPLPLFDPVSDLPIVSRETWPAVKDRHHWCMTCSVCRFFIDLEAEAAAKPWAKTHRVTPEPKPRFSSVTHALEWYLDLREFGYPVATLGEALAKIGKLGTIIRSGSDSETQAATVAAMDAVVVERALSCCYTEDSKRGLSRSERFGVLFLCSVGPVTTSRRGSQRVPVKPHVMAGRIAEANPKIKTLTGPMVSAVASEGRATLYESLRVRGMVPQR